MCDTTSGGTPLKSKLEYYENGNIPWLRSGEVDQGLVYKSEEMITEYLSHSKLPEKYVPACSKKVQQIDPKTNEIIKTYNSNREVCNVAQISTAVIRRITETGEIYNGYKWKLVCL